jgi:DNA replication protein DnaC
VVCNLCADTGWVMGVDRAVKDCECRILKKHEYRLKKSGVPDRYLTASFDNFTTKGADRSVEYAAMLSKSYVEKFPTLEDGNGLMYTGSVGTGKTHLSLAVIRDLRVKYNADTLFVDFRDLLKRMQATFGNRTLAGAQSEADILRPVLEAQVLVLDELGAARATDWTFDVVEHVINSRYNARSATIVTTNLPNHAAGYTAPREASRGYAAAAMAAAASPETLGDRIGARMFSRLQQMCTVIEVRGDDYRNKKEKK